MITKKIDINLVKDVAASYKKLMVVCEEVNASRGRVMNAIDELRDNLSALSMDTDPDPRAQIRRAGGIEAWNALTAEQRAMV